MIAKITDEERRRELARRVMRDIALNGRGDQLVTAADGTKPVIFALDHELMSVVMHRAQQVGGCVNMFVEARGNRILLAAIEDMPVGTPRHSDHFGPDDLHQDVRVGMFMEYVMSKGEAISIAVRLPAQSAGVGNVRELDGVSA
ncbi:hypothetical protein [Pseudolysinimonas sp.]|jgi:hypothetical protein|uniref:hypothetical protein n=1 Tax=Pseudolysinimonas sp. TaxID=2680009 RepID=UPI003783328B